LRAILKREFRPAIAKSLVLAFLLMISGGLWFDIVAQRVQLLWEFFTPRVGIVYLAIVGLSIGSFLLVPFLRSTPWRLCLLVLLAAGYASEYGFFRATGAHLDAVTVETLWTEREMAAAYYPLALKLSAFLVPAFIVLAWSPRKFSLPKRFVVVPVAALLLVTGVTKYTKGGLSEFPPLSPAINLVLAATSDRYFGPRRDVQYPGELSPRIRHIVFIVDESVRGDYLELTDSHKTTTPFLASRRDDFINFGNAVSAANCSAASRYILRSGLQQSQVPDTEQVGLKEPSMWQYARRAGFKTVYVDGFATGEDPTLSSHDFMNASERAAIDLSEPALAEPTYMRDLEIADKIRALLASDEPTFIFAEKFGAHFPYPATYPPGYSGTEGAFPTPDLLDPEQLRKSYRLAIQWSVDEFFKRLQPGLDLGNTLLIYTSDHGQSLFEGNYRIPHCSTAGTIHPAEANVPMVVMTHNTQLEPIFRAAAQDHYNRASHFNLFPTLLYLMGYDQSWIAGKFGNSLLAIDNSRERQFFTGYVFGSIQGHRWVSGEGLAGTSNRDDQHNSDSRPRVP
jgi:glucan phosphoethanolaminetransferase (alkaline phosphatase superfamily)